MNEKLSFVPPDFELVDYSQGIFLETYGRDVPHADLIRTVMHASACNVFYLEPNINVEGGVRGTYKGDVVDLTNWEDSTVGIIDERWRTEFDRPGNTEVREFYKEFLLWLSKQEIALENSTKINSRTAVFKMLMNHVEDLGGETLVKSVIDMLGNPLDRPFITGFSDDEVDRYFVEPPISPQQPPSGEDL